MDENVFNFFLIYQNTFEELLQIQTYNPNNMINDQIANDKKLILKQYNDEL